MRVYLDGEPREVAAGLTLAALLAAAGEPVDHALVEVNGEYVPPRRLAERALAAEDRVEVILPAFGG